MEIQPTAPQAGYMSINSQDDPASLNKKRTLVANKGAPTTTSCSSLSGNNFGLALASFNGSLKG
jgi:hypothetical protein